MLAVARIFYASFRRSIPYLIAVLWVFALALVAWSESAWAGPLSSLIPGTAKPAASSGANLVVSAAAEEEKVAPDSPRAAMTDFMRLTRAGDYEKAARYLDLSGVDQADGPILAKHLREVLDRHLWIDTDKLSPDSRGNTEDGLGAEREDLGSVPGAAGKPEPVVLVRHLDRTGARWVFSASTVAHVDDWYEHLSKIAGCSIICRGPCSALGSTSSGGGSGSRSDRSCDRWLAGRLCDHSTLAHRHPSADEREQRGNAASHAGPATLTWMIVASYALLPWLGLYEPAEAFVERGLSAALLVALSLGVVARGRALAARDQRLALGEGLAHRSLAVDAGSALRKIRRGGVRLRRGARGARLSGHEHHHWTRHRRGRVGLGGAKDSRKPVRRFFFGRRPTLPRG